MKKRPGIVHYDPSAIPGRQVRHLSLDKLVGGREAFFPMGPQPMEPLKAENQDLLRKLNSGQSPLASGGLMKGKRK